MSPRSPLYFCKKKCHVERECKNFTAPANIIVAQLNGRIHVIFSRMRQDCLRAFRISGGSFYFHQRALPFISSEVPLQNIKLSSIFQHADEKSAVSRIHFKDIVLSSSVQRQFRGTEVIAWKSQLFQGSFCENRNFFKGLYVFNFL